MKFVKTEDLKVGMRLARPIYNHNGVLLYEQNAKLTSQSISGIEKFNLIGLFILEPAEPVPPMTDSDIAFEKFQAEYVFKVEQELVHIINTKKPQRLQGILATLTKNYGHNTSKIQFIQSLRSREDYVQKHSLNVAILATMICYTMRLKLDECEEIITAALLHDIGKMLNTKNRISKGINHVIEWDRMYEEEYMGHTILDDTFLGKPNIKRICKQASAVKRAYMDDLGHNVKMVTGGKVLLVAEYFDIMTAMSVQKDPTSELLTVKKMLDRPDVFDPAVVDALIKSISIVVPGMSVELNTGGRALVLAENKSNLLRPTLLLFKDNSILDLDTIDNRDIEIVDVMKTLDNRYIMTDINRKV